MDEDQGLFRKNLQNEIVADFGQMALSLNPDLPLLMTRAAELVALGLDVELSKILELVPGKNVLLLKAGVGWQNGLVGTALVGTDLDSQAGFTLKTNDPVIVEDLRAETRFSGPALLRDHGVISGISVIIKTQDGPYGVFGAHTAKFRLFTKDDVNFLQAMANVVSMFIDQVRLRKKLQDYAGFLERNNKELRNFAYIVSHDLQEPLRKILMFGDRLNLPPDADEKNRECVARMQNAAREMKNLLDGLLEYSRVVNRNAKLEKVDLARIVAEATEDLKPRIREANGVVKTENLPTVTAEPLQMRQLFQNLIANGLKFRRDGVPSVVTITGLGKKAGKWEISVEDNGIGIEEKYVSRIFRLFERLHGKNVYQGAGIGLAICRKIVERHNGEIFVTSVPRQGSTFFIRLPE
jgi:signal transduction histidine kinase